MKSFLVEVLGILKDFILGQFTIAMLNGLIAFLGFIALGIPHAVWLGLAAGLCSLIPVVGPIMGFIPAIVMAWFAESNFWYLLLGLMGIWVLVQVLESLVWQPKILGDRMKISPWLVIPIVFLGGFFLGIFGILFAIPLVAILQAAMRRIRGNHM